MQIQLKNIIPDKIKLIKLLRQVSDNNLSECKKFAEIPFQKISIKNIYGLKEIEQLFKNIDINIDFLDEIVEPDMSQSENLEQILTKNYPENYEITIISSEDKIKSIKFLRSISDFTITKCQQLLETLPSKFEISKIEIEIEQLSRVAENIKLKIKSEKKQKSSQLIQISEKIKKTTPVTQPSNTNKFIIISRPDLKLPIIKVLREKTDIPLLECKNIVEKNPIVFYLKSNSTQNGDLLKRIVNLNTFVSIETVVDQNEVTKIYNYIDSNNIKKHDFKKVQNNESTKKTVQKKEKITPKTHNLEPIKEIEKNTNQVKPEKILIENQKIQTENINSPQTKTVLEKEQLNIQSAYNKFFAYKKPLYLIQMLSLVVVVLFFIFRPASYFSIIIISIFLTFYIKYNKKFEGKNKVFQGLLYIISTYGISLIYFAIYYYFILHFPLKLLLKPLFSDYYQILSWFIGLIFSYSILSNIFIPKSGTTTSKKVFVKSDNNESSKKEVKPKKIENNNYKKF